MLDVNAGYVSVITFNVKPDEFARLSHGAVTFIQRKASAIPGLMESIVLGNDEKTQMVLVSLWDSRENWSGAQWDDDVGQFMATLVEGATSYEVRSFERVSVWRSEPGAGGSRGGQQAL